MVHIIIDLGPNDVVEYTKSHVICEVVNVRLKVYFGAVVGLRIVYRLLKCELEIILHLKTNLHG